MRLKLYKDVDNLLFSYPSSAAPFSNIVEYHDIYARVEKDKWEFTTDITKADVIPCLLNDNWGSEFISLLNKLIRPDQILIVMNLFHNDEYMTTDWFRGPAWNIVRNLKHRTLIVHNNNYDINDPKYIFYDILFNRQKYYCFDMEPDFIPRNKVWTRDSEPEYYQLGPIDKQLTEQSKKILCLNRLYWDDSIVKRQKTLRMMLKEKFQNNEDVFLSDPSKGTFFYPNKSENNTIKVLNSAGTWYPAADRYYNSSYVNVYIESVTHRMTTGEIFCATEKTYDPLMKGNFILPFSTPGFIRGLKEMYGFKFPDWIDYAYDDIDDVRTRIDSYLRSVDKICNMDIENLHQHYLNDKHILEHNRNVIHSTPYSSLHDKVLQSASHFGWL